MKKIIQCIIFITGILLYPACKRQDSQKNEQKIAREGKNQNSTILDSAVLKIPDGTTMAYKNIEKVMDSEENIKHCTEVEKKDLSVKSENDEGSCLQLKVMTQDEKESYIIGGWMYNYPSPSSNWGFIFYDDGFFEYFERSKKAIEKLFLKAVGNWNLVDNNIEVKLLKYETIDRGTDKNIPAFLPYPEEAKSITTELHNQEWIEIGTLESVVIGRKADGYDLPPYIFLCPILLGDILINEPTMFFKQE